MTASFTEAAMRILLTNDDGIYAPGLRALRLELLKLGTGTVAAAIEGAFYRQTSIAVSLEYDKKIYDFPTGARYARQVIEQILATRPPQGSLFNVNIPVLERGPIRGVRVLPQNVSPYTE